VADLTHETRLEKIDRHTAINPWDRTGTFTWIKDSMILVNTPCSCCDM